MSLLDIVDDRQSMGSTDYNRFPYKGFKGYAVKENEWLISKLGKDNQTTRMRYKEKRISNLNNSIVNAVKCYQS